MKYPTVCIAFAMLGAGALGGWMNFLMGAKDDRDKKSLGRSLVLGIGASLMVPLLLNMISSNLMDLIRGNGTSGDPLKLLVFVGICLVAAVFSTRFIETVGDRILQEAKDARKLASDTKKEMAPLVTKFTEQPVQEGAPEAAHASIDEADGKILRALGDPKFAYRFTTGIKGDTGLMHDEVERRLVGLAKRGLAGRTVREKDGVPLWYLTSAGQQVLLRETSKPEKSN